MHRQITKKLIDTIQLPVTGSVFLRDIELKGFGVRISATGTKTFFAEGFYHPKRIGKRLSLGRYPVLSVEQAKKQARAVLYQLYCGVDPQRRQLLTQATVTDETSPAMTLNDMTERYFNSRRLKSEKGYRTTLERNFGDWMDCAVSAISRKDIEDRYCEIAISRGRKAEANAAMRYLGAILNFALADEIEGEPVLKRNPIRVLSDKKYDRTIKPRKDVIETHQLGLWVQAVQRLCSPLARDLLLLQIQTGLRDGESKGLLGEDVDFDNRLLTVRNTKNGSDFTIPMSEQIHSLLLERKQCALSDTYVFPNKTNTGRVTSIRKQMDKVRSETGIVFTHHCLRRTFASVLKKGLGVDIPTISILLNHTPQGVTQKHYLTSQPKDFRKMYGRLSKLVYGWGKEI